MALSAGQLNERIMLQEMIMKRNSIGEQEFSYRDLTEYMIPASVKFTKSVRQLSYGELWSPQDILVTTRYSERLLSAKRLLWQGKQWYLKGAPLGDRQNGSITITASLVNDGEQIAEIEDDSFTVL